MAGPLLWAIAGAIGAYLLLPSPPEPPSYTRVIVHREAIEQLEPDTVVRWIERVRVVTPAPTVVAIAPAAAAELVANFCTPSLRLARGDTTPAAPRLLLRSGSLDRGGLLQSDRLLLTGPTSTGDLWQGAWRTRGDVSFVTVGDSVLVRHDRWQLLKDVGLLVSALGLGYVAGR